MKLPYLIYIYRVDIAVLVAEEEPASIYPGVGYLLGKEKMSFFRNIEVFLDRIYPQILLNITDYQVTSWSNVTSSYLFCWKGMDLALREGSVDY